MTPLADDPFDSDYARRKRPPPGRGGIVVGELGRDMIDVPLRAVFRAPV